MRRAFILFALFLAIISQGAMGMSAENECDVADKMLSVIDRPDFEGGWKYAGSKCRETGIYKIFFVRTDGIRIAVGITLMPPAAGVSGKSVRQLYVSEGDGSEPGTALLVNDINSRIASWERKLILGANASMVFFVLLFAASISLISYAYNKSKIEPTHAPKINFVLFISVLFLIISGAELILRIGNIYPADSRLMSFMSEVRQQRIMSGGFRRVDDATEHAEESSDRDVNSIGYRGGEFPAKQKGVVRIACAGDSFMFGIGVEPGKTFTGQLQKYNREKGYQTQVLNYGVPGSNAGDIAGTLLTEAVVEKPDIAIWGFVLNDIEIMPGRSEGAFYDGVGIRFKNLEKYFQSHDLGGFRKYVRTYNYVIGVIEDRTLNDNVIDMYRSSYDRDKNPEEIGELEKYMADLVKYYTEKEIPLLIFIYPLMVDLNGDYPFEKVHEQIRTTAEKYGISVLDLLPYFRGENERDLWVSLTDHHPNARGQEIAALAVSEYLDNNILEKNNDATVVKYSAGKIVNTLKTHEELLSLAKEIENDGMSCESHKKATEYFMEKQLARVTTAKIKRMRTLGPDCEKEAADLLNGAATKISLE